ncbi:MAG: hypothetical protein WKF43_10515 [Acidimicrobiales bacterium]
MRRPCLPLPHHRRSNTDRRDRRDRSGERGAVGGLEALPFGVLVFVVGALIITNAWGVIDAKMAATSAAREAARTFVEADSRARGSEAAQAAASDVIASYQRDPSKLVLSYTPGDIAFERCNRVTFTAEYPVRPISLPFGIGFGSTITVIGRHSEIIDPLASGLPTENSCGF